MASVRRSRAEWAVLVGRWRRSGLTAAEFAERYDFSVHSLRWWSWKLASEGEETAEFVPVEVAEPVSEAPTDRAGAWVEAGGRRIFFAADADPEWVARVLGALPSC
jgi:transposase